MSIASHNVCRDLADIYWEESKEMVRIGWSVYCQADYSKCKRKMKSVSEIDRAHNYWGLNTLDDDVLTIRSVGNSFRPFTRNCKNNAMLHD